MRDGEATQLRAQLSAVQDRVRELDARVAANVEREREASQRLAQAERISSRALLAAGAAYHLRRLIGDVLADLEHAHRQLGRATGRGSDPAAEPLSEVRAGIARMRDLLELLDGDSTRSSARRSVNVERLLLSCVKMARSATDRRVHTVTEFVRVPEVLTNEARLSQAFLHLLVSIGDVALLSGQAEPTVRVVTRARAGRVCVEVTTDRPFSSMDALNALGEGTSQPAFPNDVGLSICQHLTQRLGGEMSVSTSDGLEMKVSLDLPIDPTQQRDPLFFSSVRPTRHRLGRPGS